MKIPVLTRPVGFIFGLLLITACAPSGLSPGGSSEIDAEASASAPTATRPPFATISPDESTSPANGPAGVPDAVWAAIIGALDEELDGTFDASAIELVSAEEVTWNDGSLGCPSPGEVYTQALVDGLRVVVQVEGAEYDYRLPRGGAPLLCESELPRGD